MSPRVASAVFVCVPAADGGGVDHHVACQTHMSWSREVKFRLRTVDNGIVANKSSFADQELSYKAIERLSRTLSLARGGDFNVRMTADGEGLEREIADSLNELLAMMAGFTTELERVSEGVTQGDLRARMPLDKGNGAWGQQLRAINNIVVVFGKHVAELRRVVKAVHTGDMARPMNVGPEATHRGGELARAAEDINAMITHLSQVTAEITRVFAEVGLDGRLNTQCHISDASGSWGLLVGSVNAASASLSEQVQDLCVTAQAMCVGNLSARASVTSRGDLQTLKTGLNGAAEGLGALCLELRRVCQEVTSEGKLVAEMRHPNPVGEWQSAQDAVNRMLQKVAVTVRGAAEHAERVLQGDYSPTAEPPSNGELGAPSRVLEQLSQQQEDVQQGLTALIDGRFEDVPVREARFFPFDPRHGLGGARVFDQHARVRRVGAACAAAIGRCGCRRVLRGRRPTAGADRKPRLRAASR
jgi:hypothetical protein